MFRVATWNIENAFDTLHDDGKDDAEFLPHAERRWNSSKYWRKLKGVTQTLAAMQLPAIVALQEVENDTVLRDLTKRTALANARYRYLITDSPDSRGIDVALLYNPQVFDLVSWKSIRIPCEQHGLRPTRDILLASGMIGRDTLHICVVHFPSRRNNDTATQQARSLAIETVCDVLDSLAGKHIMMMGDFNAECGDEMFNSFSPRLTSLNKNQGNLSNEKRGTYYFQGIWGYLDHILVSPSLKHHIMGSAGECRFPWLLRTEKQIPHRTYGGTSYLGGISDHLPLMVNVNF